MIETFNILITVIISSLILIIPTNAFIEKYTILKFNLNFDYIFNLLFFLNFLLLLTILNFSIITSFYIILFLYLIIIFTNFSYFKVNNLFIKITFLIFILMCAFNLAVNIELYWDSQKVWLQKAIVFFNNGTIENLDQAEKPNYPFLGSLIWAFFWKISFSDYEYLGRLPYIIIFLTSVVSVCSIIKKNLIFKLSIFFILNYFIYDFWHFRGTQEILVFSFLLICTSSIYLMNNQKNNLTNSIVFLLSLNLLIWSKNEGIIFAFFMLITICLIHNLNFNIKIKIISFGIFLIIFRLFVFHYYNFEVNLSKDFNYNNLLSYFFYNLNFKNIILITQYFIMSLFKFPYIILGIISFIFLAKNNFIDVYKYIPLLILNILFVFFIYLSTARDINEMVVTGLNRIVFEGFAFTIIFLVILVNKNKFFISNKK